MTTDAISRPWSAATLGQIRSTASAVSPAAVVLVLLAVLPWLIGWSARLAWRAVWLVLSHLGAAVVVGWRAGAVRRGPS